MVTAGQRLGQVYLVYKNKRSNTRPFIFIKSKAFAKLYVE